jgi:hypothetical protein
MEFKIGDFITGSREGKPCEAVILDKMGDHGLLVLLLPERRCEEVAAGDLAHWQLAAMPGARWVEVSRPDSPKPFFASYLPSLQAALAVDRAFREGDGGYRVVIFAASDYEEQLVEETNDPALARGYS